MMRVLAVVLLALAPALAYAKPSKSDQRRAIELVTRAAELYRAGKPVEAAALFLEAYELSEIPNQLRNAAKAYSEGGRLEDALELWKRYAAHAKISDSERAEAEAQIALIEERQRAARAEEEAASLRKAAAEAEAKRAAAAAAVVTATIAATAKPEPAPVVRTETRAPEPAAPVGAYVVIGSGAALGIAGAILFAHASSRLSDLDAALAKKDGEGRVNGIDRDAAAAQLSEINTERNLSLVTAIAGVAAIGAGLTWWLTASDASPTIAVLDRGATLSWSATW